MSSYDQLKFHGVSHYDLGGKLDREEVFESFIIIDK